MRPTLGDSTVLWGVRIFGLQALTGGWHGAYLLPIFLPGAFKIVFLLLWIRTVFKLQQILSKHLLDGERSLNFSLVLKVRVHSSFYKKKFQTQTSCGRKSLTGTGGFPILSYQKNSSSSFEKDWQKKSMYYLIFTFNLSDFSIKCIGTQLMSHIILILDFDRFLSSPGSQFRLSTGNHLKSQSIV